MLIKFNQANFTISIVVIAVTLGCNSPASDQTPISEKSIEYSEADVIAVIDAFHSALSSGDSITALSHLAEDVTILESGGVENKQHYSAGHISGDMRFAKAVPQVRGDMQVSIKGDVAWVHSTSISQGKMGDREINSQGAELVVLSNEGGVWKIRAIHWSSRRRK
jgi:ketosteroid isomerase-like protein